VDRGTTEGAEFPSRVEVVGSESLAGNWREILAGRRDPFILSLDFGAGGFLGPREMLEAPAGWPETIILMTLQRVGSHGGPDIALLERRLNLNPAKRYVTAGGVRNGEDLRRLQEAGAWGVLVASALHDGSIRSADLAAFV
jgi:phosphoribosylformimino-5-aminoimidazole carboxamide ribotide isomerase